MITTSAFYQHMPVEDRDTWLNPTASNYLQNLLAGRELS